MHVLNQISNPFSSDIPPNQAPLEWSKRMKIALHAARGLEYLHDKANPPVIYRDLKSSNILIDEEYNAKLSDFGLAKLGPVGDKSHVSSRVMGTYGYCAPEYQRTGQLTVKSDVYSYGVVLLEIITGKRAIMTTKSGTDQLLVKWVSLSSWAFKFLVERDRTHQSLYVTFKCNIIGVFCLSGLSYNQRSK